MNFLTIFGLLFILNFLAFKSHTFLFLTKIIFFKILLIYKDFLFSIGF